MFSRFRNSSKLFFIMCDAIGRQKSKMATHHQLRNTHVCEPPSRISHLSCITHCVKNSFNEFFVLENMGIAVGILHAATMYTG